MLKGVIFRFYYMCLIVTQVKFVLCVRDESAWHSYQFGTGHGNREELSITKVVSDESFNLGKNVVKWKSISAGSRNYAVGLMANGVTTIIAELSPDKGSFVISSNISEFTYSVNDIELFGHWNEDSGKQDIILIVASSGSSPELLWFRINEHSLDHFWTWHAHKLVSHLHYFKLEDNKCKLLVLNKVKEKSTADIYEFILRNSKQDFWLSQTLQLSSSANNSAINTYGSTVYLSIPQHNLDIVLVYKLNNNRFAFYQNISSHGVTQICSFKIGFKSFLAIGGENGGIYSFTKQDIVPQRIDGLHLQVDFWFPVPLKTYRDEVILILQRSVYHGSHRSYFLEVVLYDGSTLVAHEEIACYFYGEKEHGLACMVDEEGDHGLFGAAILSLGSTLGILVPRKDITTLFIIHTAMKILRSPAELEMQQLVETRKRLQKMITEQQMRIDAVQKRLQNSLKLNEPNVVKAQWKLDTLAAPSFQENLKSSIPVVIENLQADGVNTEDLQSQAANIRSVINNVKSQLLNVIPLNKTEHDFSELIIDGEIQVQGETKFKSITTENFNDDQVVEAFSDLVRKSNTNLISGHKTFTNLKVENVTFEAINGMKASNIMFNTETPVIINGNLIFQKPLQILGNVSTKKGINEYDLTEEVVEMHKKYEEPLKFEQINVAETLDVGQINNVYVEDTFKVVDDSKMSNADDIVIDKVRISGNIVVENINGENFDEFKKCLYLTNIEIHISEETIIDGDLIVQESANMQVLNNLKFPEDYILLHSSLGFKTISGNKVFKGPVLIGDIITRRTVNGLTTENFLTLTKNQSLSGNYIFNDLEVTENLKVDGVITGSYADNFLQNPVLPESKEIKTNVIFKHLEVEGNIRILRNLNDANFEELLKDVVYTNEEEVFIASIKDFPGGLSVTNGLSIASGKINDIALNSVMMTNTEQIILLKTLNGPVSFENLLLDGLYGDIDITKLDQDCIKLTGEQFVSSTITFINNDDEIIDISAADFLITNTLNNLTSRDYYFIRGDSRHLENAFDLDNLHAQNFFIQGELTGIITNFSLDEFDARRMSATNDQNITATYTVKDFVSESLNAYNINGELFDKFFSYQYFADAISEMLFDGKLEIKNLHVNRSLLVVHANAENMRDLLKDCIWKDKNNNFESVVFKGNAVFQNLNIKYFNGVEFKLFTDNIVLKTEINPIINGFKTFTGGFRVARILNSERLNNIHVDDILTKTGPQELAGLLNIYGNVIISDSEIFENLNDVSVEYMSKTYKFINDTCIINDDLVLDRLAYMEKLYVDGFSNEENVEEFLQNVVYKATNAILLEKIIFENTVEINQDLIIKDRLNNADLSDFIQDMVFITSDNYIEKLITFIQSVDIEEKVTIESNLNARYLLGIDLESWNENAVFINNGIISGKLTFESVTIQGELFLEIVNNLNLRTLIPLGTGQYINQSLDFGAITPFHDIPVRNYINGLRLEEEFQNSFLMIDSSQQLMSSVTFRGNVLVRNNLETFGLVNGRNLSNIVTTNTDQNLTALYRFNARVRMDSNLMVFGSVNGINISEWEKKSTKMYIEHPQIIYDSWVIDGNTTFSQSVDGGGLLSGMNIRKIADHVEEKRLVKFSTEKGLLMDYINICKDINEILDTVQNQIYLFKYLEYLQIIEFDNDIGNVHYFKHRNQNYVLISEKNVCISHLFVWDKSRFQRIKQLALGKILQFISVFDGDFLFLVSRNDVSSPDCDVEGTNIWRFESDNLIRLYKQEDYQVLQESLAPGTFYALSKKFVIEYKLTTFVETNIKINRKWIINSENLAFVPRGLATGLALSNGYDLYRLIRTDPVIEDEYGYETDAYIIGNVIKEVNSFLSGYNGGDILVVNVGAVDKKRSLVAVASHEETSVKGRLDFIKIYENIFSGKIFHKVPAYKASSLISLEFGSGETLLIFLEDEKTLQVYEYRGIEGFKHRISVKLEGSELVKMTLPIELNRPDRSVIGIIKNNKITLMQVVMMGNQIFEGRSNCEL